MNAKKNAFGIMPIAGMLLLAGSGCTSLSEQNSPSVQWMTTNPAGIEPSTALKAAGPFHLAWKAPLMFVNLEKDYSGDDTPWLDKTDEMREELAAAMNGYEPDALTLGDYVWARNNFLSEHLGRDYVLKDNGKHGEEGTIVAGGSIDGYAVIQNKMYTDLFKLWRQPAKGKIAFRVVQDCYWASSHGANDTNEPVSCRDISVYLETSKLGEDYPVPKATFSLFSDRTVQQLKIDGTERTVGWCEAVDIQTPRGRKTVYLPNDYNLVWAPDPQCRLVGLAIVNILNSLPDEKRRLLYGD